MKEQPKRSECCDESKATSIESAKSKLNVEMLLSTLLRKVDCKFQLVRASEHERTLANVVQRSLKLQQANIVIVYAVRNPGCNLCRETGKMLSDMVKKDQTLHLISVIKEIGKADQMLLEYHTDYCQRTPIYLDAKWNVYKAMGGRKISRLSVAWRLIGSIVRTAKKDIYANVDAMKTDFWTQGGVFFFDRTAELVHTIYEPAFGDEMDTEEIREAIWKCRLGFNILISPEVFV